MTSRYWWQRASKLSSVATNRRTVSSSSENLASNGRMHSTTSFVAMRSSCVPSDASRGTSREDRGLGFHLSNLIDDLGIGQRRDIAGILIVRNRSENAAHDLPRTGLWHIGDNHERSRVVCLGASTSNGCAMLLQNGNGSSKCLDWIRNNSARLQNGARGPAGTGHPDSPRLPAQRAFLSRNRFALFRIV